VDRGPNSSTCFETGPKVVARDEPEPTLTEPDPAPPPAAYTTPEAQAFIDAYAARAPALTATGYEVEPLPRAMFARLVARVAATWGAPGRPHFQPEHARAADALGSALADVRWGHAATDAPGGMMEPLSFVNRGDLSYQRVIDELHPRFERWAGVPLVPVQFYGPRVYLRHALLLRHIDHPATHLVSGSITLAAELEAPWPIVLEREGAPVAIDLQPGELLMYEGARLPHYRPYPLRGASYINLYVHFAPYTTP